MVINHFSVISQRLRLFYNPDGVVVTCCIAILSHQTNVQAVGVRKDSKVPPLTDIGHSAAISETFMPKVIPSTGKKILAWALWCC